MAVRWGLIPTAAGDLKNMEEKSTVAIGLASILVQEVVREAPSRETGVAHR